MSDWKELANFMYGDVLKEQGFWYSHVLREVQGLTEEQLYWSPDPHSLCILWHVGHIAHRERLHIGGFLQGIAEPFNPPQFDVFGPEWASVKAVRQSVGSVDEVFAWVHSVRIESQKYIESLRDDDFHTAPLFSEMGLSVASWLFITACHTSLHIGRIQLLRAILEGKPERAC